MSATMHVLLTGATGFLGRQVLTRLLQEQEERMQMTCLVRDPAKVTVGRGDPRIRWLTGDLLAPETYQNDLAEITHVLHAAALVGLRNGEAFYQANREGTRALLQACQRCDALKRFELISSISAIDRPSLRSGEKLEPLTENSPPHPGTDYGQSKLQAEALVQQSGLPWTIARPAYIYGPQPRVGSSMDRLVHDVLRGAHYTRLPWPGHVSAMGVEDLADALVRLMIHPEAENRVFFTAEPEAVSVSQVIQDLAVLLGVSCPVEPGWTAHRMAILARRLMARQPGNRMIPVLSTDAFVCDTSAMRGVLGSFERMGLAESMVRTVNWYRTRWP